MVTAYLGIGSNIGDRDENFRAALRHLESTGRIKIKKSSRFYHTKPVGGPPQKDYLNGVLEVETDFSPFEFLGALKEIEAKMGREPFARDHPRIIDMDILLYNGLVLEYKSLVIPHPRMHLRYFVLKGLAEIAPEAVHPVSGRTVKELYCEVSQGSPPKGG
ncbi:MAG: 2-amino-4-hydroxy-6-hydroxymethyldihydropteridine diphosphokinase [Candidatus Omnitrophota bacterium]